MSDLISRSALKDKAMRMYEAGKVWGIAPLAHEAVLVADIDCAPAVDAVPVVRCRECKHRGSAYKCPMRKLVMPHEGPGAWEDCTEDEGYCSKGEKREDGGDAGGKGE